jgi:small subunit ribosomal protein S4
MSRFTGPRVKIMRALGTELPGLSRKKIERRPYPPGQHGQARKKVSEYGRRLHEKQKLRMNYGLHEGQLRRLVVQASRGGGNPGDKLLELLERRLDNVVFRAGFARTIPAARQLVCHGHVKVNDHRVDIASFRTRAGDVITVEESSRTNVQLLASLQDQSHPRAPWIDIEADKFLAKIRELPDNTSILFPIDIQLVIEFYSQNL